MASVLGGPRLWGCVSEPSASALPVLLLQVIICCCLVGQDVGSKGAFSGEGHCCITGLSAATLLTQGVSSMRLNPALIPDPGNRHESMCFKPHFLCLKMRALLFTRLNYSFNLLYATLESLEVLRICMFGTHIKEINF